MRYILREERGNQTKRENKIICHYVSLAKIKSKTEKSNKWLNISFIIHSELNYLRIQFLKYISTKSYLQKNLAKILPFSQCVIRHIYQFGKLIKIWERGQSWRRGTKCDWRHDWLWVRSLLEKMKILFKFILNFFALVSEMNLAKSGECLNTRFPLPTRLCAW